MGLAHAKVERNLFRGLFLFSRAFYDNKFGVGVVFVLREKFNNELILEFEINFFRVSKYSNEILYLKKFKQQFLKIIF
jgi:hypothetical protein